MLDDSLIEPALIFAVIGCGVMAGLFFIFSISVMKSMKELKRVEGIRAMQSINRTIVRPIFLLFFIGTPLVCLFLLVRSIGHMDQIHGQLTSIGCIVYLIASFALTFILHIPMNNKLAAMEAESDEGKKYWPEFLSRWTFWNHVRGLASFVALVLFTFALAGI